MSRLAVPAVVAALGVVVLVGAFAALMLVRGCLGVLVVRGPPPPPPSSTPAPPRPVTSKEALVDLARWDAATSAARRAAAEDVARRVPDFALLRLETFSCGGQTHEVAIYMHAKTGMEFVLVPGGTFVMGSPDTEEDGGHDETQHRVTLTRPFLIARTPCAQTAYEKVVGSSPSARKGPTLPVETVSWDDAKAFCTRVGLELPTEAQWEYACRAGTITAYCFGDWAASLLDYAWYGRNSDVLTHSVGEKKPNAFGLHDMHGNVWEWCLDWYESYASDSVTDAVNETASDDRVLRGAGCTPDAGGVRSACRTRAGPGDRNEFTGFRPAKTVPLE